MKRPDLSRWLERLWYGRSRASVLLAPLGLVYGALTGIRRLLYRARILRVERISVPVIVVGNITVGGAGKTPIVEWVVRTLTDAGYRPGIVSRGYRGRRHRVPRQVTAEDVAAEVGDEPLLLCRRTGAPVAVCVDRVAAARYLLGCGADVIVADDGLQHLALGRDIEIVVIDGERRLGNGRLLPAGPLREGPARLAQATIVLVNGGPADGEEHPFELAGDTLVGLDRKTREPAAAFSGRKVRMLAGIGNPARFRRRLEAAGMRVEPVPLPDHGVLPLHQLRKLTDKPLIMTEKDAVKYPPLPDPGLWFLPVKAEVPVLVADMLLTRVRAVQRARQAAGARGERPHR
jgi:tetraacyldisaccharide 4'-kinase